MPHPLRHLRLGVPWWKLAMWEQGAAEMPGVLARQMGAGAILTAPIQISSLPVLKHA